MVWHVTEAMGGGLATAIHQFVRSTPGYRHYLIGAPRARHATGDASLFEGVVYSRREGPLGLATVLVTSRSRIPAPDIVHVHSAWAGLLARILLLPHRGRLVYSPHSYYFERTDVRPVVRSVARGVEGALGRLTRMVVAVSPHEAAQAERLGTPVRFVPNVADVPDVRRPSVPPADQDRPRLVTVGRVEAQKDPRFFAETIAAVKSLGRDVDAVWVGAGEPELEAVLREVGVEVTGWVDRSRALAEMAAADVYVHTAAWEGNPLTVLEAEALGRRLAVRSIPAMVSLGHPVGHGTPAELARTIVDLLDGAPPAPRGAPTRDAYELGDVYDEVVRSGSRPDQ